MVNVSFCSCEAEAVTLVRFSLWPATPTNPTFAFHQDLLLWLEALLVEACIGADAFCRTLDYKVGKRLVRMQLVQKSMCGEEVARKLISCLSVTFGIHSYQVLGAMRDRASVNNVAVTTLKVVYPSILDVGCTLDHVGEIFLVTTLTDFITAWISLFCHSCKARIAWKEQTQIAMKTHSATRWWSKFEIIKQVFDLFGDETFLRRHDYLAPSTRAKLLAVFDNARKKVYLELELATLVNAVLPFVQATYKLEGDGPLVFDCYDTISSLTTAIHVAHYPNVSQRIVQAHSYSKQQLLATQSSAFSRHISITPIASRDA